MVIIAKQESSEIFVFSLVAISDLVNLSLTISVLISDSIAHITNHRPHPSRKPKFHAPILHFEPVFVVVVVVVVVHLHGPKSDRKQQTWSRSEATAFK